MDNDYSLILKQLTRMADALERLASGGEPTAPDYQKSLDEYAGFDWSTINAKVIATDVDGPTHVEWQDALWIRRSPQNKFGDAIWYSRPAGKDADGTTKYLRLITFRKIAEAEPLPRSVANAVSSTSKPAAAPRPAAPAAAPLPAPVQNSTARVAAPVYSSGPQGEPVASQPAPKPVPYNDFYKEAQSKRFGLSVAEARAIAIFGGIDLNRVNHQTDFSRPFSWLAYFAEAKSRGMDLDTTYSILRAASHDLSRATESLRKQMPGHGVAIEAA